VERKYKDIYRLDQQMFNNRVAIISKEYHYYHPPRPLQIAVIIITISENLFPIRKS